MTHALAPLAVATIMISIAWALVLHAMKPRARRCTFCRRLMDFDEPDFGKDRRASALFYKDKHASSCPMQLELTREYFR